MQYKVILFTLFTLTLNTPTTVHGQDNTLPSHKKTELIRVMSFNIRRFGPEKSPDFGWKKRASNVCNLIDKINPTIFGLQEATKRQIDDIQQHIKDSYKWVGKGRGSSWFGLGKNEYTPLFYDSNRLTLIQSNTMKINDNKGWFLPWNIKKTGYLPRICTWAQFKEKKTNTTFWVFNTHLDNKFDKARKNGIKKVARTIKGILETNQEPTFLLGDFNTSLTPAFKKKIPFLFDTKEHADKKTGPDYTSIGWRSNLKKNIDHILYNKKNIQITHHVIEKQKDDVITSDHSPVYIDITFV